MTPSMNLEAILFYTLAIVAANLPFLSERILFVKTPNASHKAFGWRLLEWGILYCAIGLFARLLETQRTPVHEQGWVFYAITLALFIVFAWPGFVWRYFWRKPGI